jgi:hypothetical protein
VDLISCKPSETDVLAMLVLHQSYVDLIFASHRRLTFLPCLCCISSYVDFISCKPSETDVLAVLVLDQFVRGFYFLQAIGVTDVLAVFVLHQRHRSTWILFLASHRRLTFLPCLCCIRKLYVDLISCKPSETDVLSVLVLHQIVRGFDFLQAIGD